MLLWYVIPLKLRNGIVRYRRPKVFEHAHTRSKVAGFLGGTLGITSSSSGRLGTGISHGSPTLVVRITLDRCCCNGSGSIAVVLVCIVNRNQILERRWSQHDVAIRISSRSRATIAGFSIHGISRSISSRKSHLFHSLSNAREVIGCVASHRSFRRRSFFARGSGGDTPVGWRSTWGWLLQSLASLFHKLHLDVQL